MADTDFNAFTNGYLDANDYLIAANGAVGKNPSAATLMWTNASGSATLVEGNPPDNGVYNGIELGSYGQILNQKAGTSQLAVGWNVLGGSTNNNYRYKVSANIAALHEITSDGTQRFRRAAAGTAGDDIVWAESLDLEKIGVGWGLTFGYMRVGQATSGASPSFIGWNIRETATIGQYAYAKTGDRATAIEMQSDGSVRIMTAPVGTAGVAISFTTALTVNGDGTVSINLPTSNPGVGKLWNDSGTVKVGT